MILAAARYANGEEGATKPKELALWDQCRHFSTLPRAGGILDQPFGLLDRMRVANAIVKAIREYNANWDKGDWAAENPDTMQIMTRYWDLREKVENGPI